MGSSPNLVTPRQTFIYLFLQYYLFLWRTFSRYLHQISAPHTAAVPWSPRSSALESPPWIPLKELTNQVTCSAIFNREKCRTPLPPPVSHPDPSVPLANQHSKSSRFQRIQPVLWEHNPPRTGLTRISIKGNKSISVSLGSWQFLKPTEALGFGLMSFTTERAKAIHRQLTFNVKRKELLPSRISPKSRLSFKINCRTLSPIVYK